MPDQVRLAIATASGESDLASLEDLNTWLRGEVDLAGRVAFDRSAPRAGEMGSMTDALIVAVSAQGAVSVLAASLREWFRQPRRASVRIRVATGRGAYAEIDADRVRSPDLDRLLSQALSAATEQAEQAEESA